MNNIESGTDSNSYYKEYNINNNNNNNNNNGNSIVNNSIIGDRENINILII